MIKKFKNFLRRKSPGKNIPTSESPGKSFSGQKSPGKSLSGQKSPGKGSSRRKYPGKSSSGKKSPGKSSSRSKSAAKKSISQKKSLEWNKVVQEQNDVAVVVHDQKSIPKGVSFLKKIKVIQGRTLNHVLAELQKENFISHAKKFPSPLKTLDQIIYEFDMDFPLDTFFYRKISLDEWKNTHLFPFDDENEHEFSETEDFCNGNEILHRPFPNTLEMPFLQNFLCVYAQILS